MLRHKPQAREREECLEYIHMQPWESELVVKHDKSSFGGVELFLKVKIFFLKCITFGIGIAKGFRDSCEIVNN